MSQRNSEQLIPRDQKVRNTRRRHPILDFLQDAILFGLTTRLPGSEEFITSLRQRNQDRRRVSSNVTRYPEGYAPSGKVIESTDHIVE